MASESFRSKLGKDKEPCQGSYAEVQRSLKARLVDVLYSALQMLQLPIASFACF